MRILFYADGRSPIALNWMRYFVDAGHQVHLASSHPCEIDLNLASFTVIPVAMSGLKTTRNSDRGKKSFVWGGGMTRLRTWVRQALGPATLQPAARRLGALIAQTKPDLVHAMRIPYEGMAAAIARQAAPSVPLLVSVWGNDFTLHARSTRWMAALTRRCMQAASALHTDCRRDLRLARGWDFSEQKPAVVLPGAGGVRAEVFYPPGEDRPAAPAIINPRGFRAYVRNDTFFRSIPMVRERLPSARFYCTGMADEPRAQRWLKQLGITPVVQLLPAQTPGQMGDLFRKCQVSVSASTHDGTPNTLLEAMACGCFPVAGDLESLREWITPGVNGLLFDPGDRQALAEAILLALEQPGLRQQAMEINTRLVSERAEYGRVMRSAEAFLQDLI